jgi:hypothetical protein
MTVSKAKLPPYSSLAEPLLAFSSVAAGGYGPHPLRGLVEHGPFSATSFSSLTSGVRIAIVGPESGKRARRTLLTSLRERLEPTDRKDYLPAYPGFESIFRVGVVPASSEAQLTLAERLEDIESDAAEPHLRVADELRRTMSRLSAVRDRFDVAVIHLPSSWSKGFRARGFDAHDLLKGLGAEAGIPTQVINDDTFTFRYTASRSWRLAIAIYAKAGGTPWKLAPLEGVPDGTAYIGLAYALRGDPQQPQFVTCCSQVFDADGGGMQFVAYDARDPLDDPRARDNPYLSRDDMRSVLARSLRLYQSRNGGGLPRRVVVHKTTPFRENEIAGAFDALAAVDELECVEITTNVAWRGVWLDASRDKSRKSEAARYPVRRGTVLPLSGTEALLWVAGNAPEASTGASYYQGGKSIPTPLMLKRHVGRGSLELVALEALALTKMDWNNDALYDPVPVTIRYSQRLARTIANVPDLRREVYPYRLFM